MTRRRQTMVTITIGGRHRLPRPQNFNQPWAAGIYKEGLEVAVSGTVTRYRNRLQLANQEAEIIGGDERDLVHTGQISARPSGIRRHHDQDESRARCSPRSSNCRRSSTRCRPS